MKKIDSGGEELIWDKPCNLQDWLPNGEAILCGGGIGGRGTQGSELWIVPVEADREPQTLTFAGDAPGIKYGYRISPDGGWIASISNETGNFEIYTRRFPAGSDRKRVSVQGGFHPRWGPMGDELYFWGVNAMVGRIMRAEVTRGPNGLDISAPVPIIEPVLHGLFDARTNYAVTPDGERFLARRPSLDPPAVTLVFNWTAELEP